MKIEAKEPTYLKEYDVYVKPYLTYDEIQAIADAACKCNTWVERQQVIDYNILKLAAGLSDEDLQKIGPNELLGSGLINETKIFIENYYDIDDAIKYQESIERQLKAIASQLPEIGQKILAELPAVAKDAVARANK